MTHTLVVLLAVFAAIVSAAVNVDSTSQCTSSCGSASSPHSNLADALGDIPNGGELLLAPGTYTGTNNINVVLQSGQYIISGTDSDDVSVIDCETNGFGFELNSGTFTLRNLKLVNCRRSEGAGVRVTNSYAELHNVHFDGNEASTDGGGLYVSSGTVKIFGGSFKNSNAARGGAIVVESAYLAFYAPFSFEDNDSPNGKDLSCKDATIELFDDDSNSLPSDNTCPACEIIFKKANNSESTRICGSGRGQDNTNPCNFAEAQQCNNKLLNCVFIAATQANQRNSSGNGQSDLQCGCYGAYGVCVGDSKCADGLLYDLYKDSCEANCDPAQCSVSGVDTPTIPYTKLLVLRLIACNFLEEIVVQLEELFSITLGRAVVVKVKSILGCSEFDTSKRATGGSTIELYVEGSEAEQADLMATAASAVQAGQFQNVGVESATVLGSSSGSKISATFNLLLLAFVAFVFTLTA